MSAQDSAAELAARIRQRAPLDAASMLADEPVETIQSVLAQTPPSLALRLLRHLPQDRVRAVRLDDDSAFGSQWRLNRDYPEHTLGRFMEAVPAAYPAGMTAAEAIEDIRRLSRQAHITYAYVTDDERRLLGLVVMRDLMLAPRDARLDEIMVRDPFYLTPETTITAAMQATVMRHYPVYPVCDDTRRLIGLLQGYVLFEEHAFDLSAQSGRMVGIEKEEHLRTPLLTSFRQRHPWLQLNLLTAFFAALVVGLFEDLISKVVLLAVFLPVLMGQSSNTGGQALAITLRAMTLGEFRDHSLRHALVKESLLGFANGLLVGLAAGAAMYAYARYTHNPAAGTLAFVVVIAMLGSCVISGVCGVLIPATLRRLGADPATASTIFLTTATDVVSMSLFLGIAAWLLF